MISSISSNMVNPRQKERYERNVEHAKRLGDKYGFEVIGFDTKPNGELLRGFDQTFREMHWTLKDLKIPPKTWFGVHDYSIPTGLQPVSYGVLKRLAIQEDITWYFAQGEFMALGNPGEWTHQALGNKVEENYFMKLCQQITDRVYSIVRRPFVTPSNELFEVVQDMDQTARSICENGYSNIIASAEATVDDYFTGSPLERRLVRCLDNPVYNLTA